MSGPVVRLGHAADAAALGVLRQQFWEGQRDFGLRDIPRPAAIGEDEAARLLKRARTAIVVADDEGTLVGYAFVTMQIAPHLQAGKVALLEEIYVAPAGAGRGIGGRLATMGFDTLSPDRSVRRQIRVLADNPAGIAFWKRQGFETTLLTMEAVS